MKNYRLPAFVLAVLCSMSSLPVYAQDSAEPETQIIPISSPDPEEIIVDKDPEEPDESENSNQDTDLSGEIEEESSPEDLTGFAGDSFYNYADGTIASGWIYVDGDIYYADENGQLVKDEVRQIGNNTYSFDTDGKIIRGFVSLPGENEFYSLLNGAQLSGVHTYNSALYLLGRYNPGSGSLITYNGNEYYQKANGSVAMNEVMNVNGTKYYFGDNGARITYGPVFTQYGWLFLDRNGNEVSYTDYVISQECQRVFEQVGTSLASVFNWVVSSITYRSDSLYKSAEEYALQGFQQHWGNCLAFAATFYYLASELGFTARLVKGNVLYTNGNVGVHGWVMINENGKEYIYDPEAEYELGGNGKFFREDPNYPYINYLYPSGQGPQG